MNIIIAGKSDIAVKALIYLWSEFKDHKIYVLPSKSDLDSNGWQLSLKSTAAELNIEIIENFDNFYNIKDLVILSLEYDKIIHVNKFATERIYNIHFSYLPYYRGVYTSIFPILNNEKYSGVTLHKVDEGIDSGDIIDQIRMKITDSMTSWDLYHLYNYYAYQLFKKNIHKIVYNELKSTPQDSVKMSYYSRKDIDFSIRNIQYEDLLKKDASDLYRLMRAFYFPVYQFPEYENREIDKFYLIDDKCYNETITASKVGENQLLLQCYKGCILICLKPD